MWLETTAEMPLLSQGEAVWLETTAEMPLLSQGEAVWLETTAEMPLLSQGEVMWLGSGGAVCPKLICVPDFAARFQQSPGNAGKGPYSG
ncbi:hypothetical protein AML91_07540 [Paenibacillus jilunlii]|uniref:Uncharacterized protein n=2 Tax=Paenibacillus jilunlii TaxID=682956 RepID=A0ABR5SYA2_9BACL|nr:hypothetical protein AML91_07540 [Paenibacillus jilunlii]